MKIIGQISALLMLLCALSACNSMEREILCKNYEGVSSVELHRKSKDGKWAVYNAVERKYDSDFIYDSFEALNIAEIRSSEYLYTLTSNGEKYLYDAIQRVYLFEGEPYEYITRDNEGYPVAKGKSRLYPMAHNNGLPTGVDEYWRIGRNTFVYRKDGQHGVFQVKRGDKYDKFISVIAPTYSPITVMAYTGQKGALCFVTGEGNNRSIIDTDGLERTMRYNPGDYWTKWNSIWELNTPPYDGASYEEHDPWHHDVTSQFFKLLDKMPVDGSEHYYSQLKAKCTRTGNKQCSMLMCNPIELSYQ